MSTTVCGAGKMKLQRPNGRGNRRAATRTLLAERRGVLQVSGSIQNKGSSEAGSLAAVPAQNATSNLHVGRRREPRQDVDSRVVIRLVNLAADVRGQIIDISKGGCRIRTDRPFPVGVFRRVEVDFCVDGLPFRFPGVTQAIY